MKYCVDLPYPPVTIASVNNEYGQMILDNVGGMTSEMSAVSSYVYNHVISGDNFKDLKEAFLKIGIVEMHHLDIFCDLSLKLGMDPRLWTCTNEYNEYWSPAYNNYPNQLQELLENAIINEEKAIEKYTFQASVIKDPNIVNILNRIIMDEKLHVEILEGFYNKLVRNI